MRIIRNLAFLIRKNYIQQESAVSAHGFLCLYFLVLAVASFYYGEFLRGLILIVCSSTIIIADQIHNPRLLRFFMNRKEWDNNGKYDKDWLITFEDDFFYGSGW